MVYAIVGSEVSVKIGSKPARFEFTNGKTNGGGRAVILTMSERFRLAIGIETIERIKASGVTPPAALQATNMLAWAKVKAPDIVSEVVDELISGEVGANLADTKKAVENLGESYLNKEVPPPPLPLPPPPSDPAKILAQIDAETQAQEEYLQKLESQIDTAEKSVEGLTQVGEVALGADAMLEKLINVLSIVGGADAAIAELAGDYSLTWVDVYDLQNSISEAIGRVEVHLKTLKDVHAVAQHNLANMKSSANLIKSVLPKPPPPITAPHPPMIELPSYYEGPADTGGWDGIWDGGGWDTGSGGCFAADAKFAMHDGTSMRIADIKVGDKLRGLTSPIIVKGVVTHNFDRFVRITKSDGRVLEVSGRQTIRTIFGPVRAEMLAPGAELLNEAHRKDRSYQGAKVVRVERVLAPKTLYNFVMADSVAFGPEMDPIDILYQKE